VQSKVTWKLLLTLPKSPLILIPSQPLLQAVSAKGCHSAYSHCSHRLPVPPLTVKLASRPPGSQRAGTSVCLCIRQPPPTAMPFILFLCRTWAHAPPLSSLQLGLPSARLLSSVSFADPHSASQSRVATSVIDYLPNASGCPLMAQPLHEKDMNALGAGSLPERRLLANGKPAPQVGLQSGHCGALLLSHPRVA